MQNSMTSAVTGRSAEKSRRDSRVGALVGKFELASSSDIAWAGQVRVARMVDDIDRNRKAKWAAGTGRVKSLVKTFDRPEPVARARWSKDNARPPIGKITSIFIAN